MQNPQILKWEIESRQQKRAFIQKLENTTKGNDQYINFEDWGKTLKSPPAKKLFKCPYFMHEGLGFCFEIYSEFFFCYIIYPS